MKLYLVVAKHSDSEPWVVEIMDEWSVESGADPEEMLETARNRVEYMSYDVRLAIINVPDDFLSSVFTVPETKATP